MPFSYLFRVFVLLAAFCATASPSFAACTSPSGNAGDISFSSAQGIMAYCNGLSWVSMGASSSITFGTLTTNNFCTASGSTSIACTTTSTGSGNVVLSAAPTLTGTVVGASSTWSGQVAIGTTTLSGALNISGAVNVAGTVTATTFSGSGASLTSIPISGLSATGTPSSTTYLRGDGTWSTITGLLSGGTANYVPLWTGATTLGTSNIYQSGSNIGIGSTSPYALLNIVGTNTSQTQGIIQVDGNMTVYGVGIYVNNTAAAGSQTTFLKGDVGGSNRFKFVSDSTGMHYQSGTTQTWDNASGGVLMTLLNGGSLGIGTGTPLNTFDVYSGGIHIGSSVPSSTTAALYNNGGTLMWNGATVNTGATGLTIASTTVSAGTSGRVLYDNTGSLGEYSISGSGNVAMTTSPVFTTPNLGTPSALTLTNATGLPIAGISTTGTANSTTFLRGDGAWTAMTTMTYPGAGIPNSTGSAWGTSYSVTGTGNVALSASPTFTGTITAAAITASGVLTDSAAGAASAAAVTFTGAPYTAGTATTNYPLIYLNAGTAPTTWSTTGTEFGINSPSGFTGNLIDTHINGGASVFSVNYQGNVTATQFNGSGAGLSNTTVPIAAINASGTASSSTYLRGDGTWASVGGGTVSGSGSTNYIAKFTSSSAVGSSLIYDSGTAIGINTATPTSTLTVNGTQALQFGSDWSTTTATQNDVAINTASAVRYTGAGSATFTGIAAGNAGQILYLTNAATSTNTLTLNNQDAGSAAANRIITGTGAALTMANNSSVVLQYDGAASRWRVIGGSGGGGTLAGLSDVTLTSPASGNLLSYNGSKWVNATASSAVTAAVAPSFMVTLNTSQTVTAGTNTKIAFDTVSYDSNSNWSTSNKRYTPTVAGKYLITGHLGCGGVNGYCIAFIYKNGGEVVESRFNSGGNTADSSTTIDAVVDMNGTTDYVELWGYSSGTTFAGGNVYTYMSGGLLAPLASGSVAGTGTASYVPYWTSSTNLSNSPMTVSGSNIGVGTTNPTSQLQIYGNSNMLGLRSNLGSQIYNLGVTSSGSGDFLIDDTTASARRITIQASTGNIGIGSATPLQTLHVYGSNARIDASTGEGLYLFRAGGNANDVRLNTSRGSIAAPTTSASGDLAGQLHFQVYDGAAYQDRAMVSAIVDGTVSAGNTPTALRFSTGTTTQTEYMRITSSGNVGINTTNNSYRIEVNGTSGFDNWMYINPSVGISVQGSGTLNLGGTGETSAISFNTTGGGSKMYINSSGSVGIGSTSPSTTLDVNGTIRSASGGFKFPDGTTQTTAASGGSSGADVQTFTSSGTWTKPSGKTRTFVECWGGGGSGSKGGVNPTGGGGGAYIFKWFTTSSLGATEAVTIGAGGAAVSANGNGNQGGNSSFGSWLTGYGGGPGQSNGISAGGGWKGAGGVCWPGAGYDPSSLPLTAGGGGTDNGYGSCTTGGNYNSFYGGGSGGYNSPGGNSVYGGAGGGRGSGNGIGPYSGGTSFYGGAGGAGTNSTSGGSGSTPGGGGGGTATGSTSGAGGGGECIISSF